MISTGNELMDAYSQLSRGEQAKFDKRFKDLLKFRRNLKLLVKAAQQGKLKERMAS